MINGVRKCLVLAVVWLALVPASVVAQEESDPDPWEGFNRGVYEFNDFVDRYVLKPVAIGYRKVTPDIVEVGISNFFGNLREVRTIFNDVCQLKLPKAARDSARFVVNTTVGLVGFIDVGTRIGLESQPEDFGQTFGYWGIPSGPYLVLPFLGPSTVRDTVGLAPDWWTGISLFIEDEWVVWGLVTLDIVNTRAELLDMEKHVVGDRYTFIRDAYLQKREYNVNDGESEYDFLDDDMDFLEDEYEDTDEEYEDK